MYYTYYLKSHYNNNASEQITFVLMATLTIEAASSFSSPPSGLERGSKKPSFIKSLKKKTIMITVYCKNMSYIKTERAACINFNYVIVIMCVRVQYDYIFLVPRFFEPSGEKNIGKSIIFVLFLFR